MMQRRSRVLLSGLTLGLTLTATAARESHAQPAPKPAPGVAQPPVAKEVSVADAGKLLAFFDQLIAAMLVDKDDCARMASTVDGLVTANAAMLKGVMKQLAEGKALPKDAEAKLTARMSKDAAALDKCASDQAVGNAMKRIGNPDLPPAPPASVLAAVKPPVAADLATYTKGIAGKGELIATIKTSVGTVRCQLLADKAPMTVANFVGLATGKKPWLDPMTNKLQKGKPYYDGTTFHRVIPDFMIQGGDPTGTGTGGPGYQFGDETSPDIKMAPGVLAMANAGPGTNGSQFFITESAPSYLDGKHTIFGTCKPLDAVSKIARVKRGADDKPQTAVKMTITISRGAL
jgi:cyclophilin family peptidyl-prolyl cis-trans isomerase